MIEVLKEISKIMKKLKLNYAFERWNKEVSYPYFIGEYQETDGETEDGMEDISFIITGWDKGTTVGLLKTLEDIKVECPNTGYRTITDSGSAIAIFFDKSFMVPTENAELKRIEINLKIKEWKMR